MRGNPKDFAAGGLFIAIGLFFALSALINLRLGETRSMGPGYFPFLLGSILVAFGIVIAIRAIGKPKEAFGRVSWRGVFLVTIGIAFFGITVRGLGLVPALAISTFLAGKSSDRLSFVGAAIVSACLTAFCTVLFVYALGLPYPVIGPWLGG